MIARFENSVPRRMSRLSQTAATILLAGSVCVNVLLMWRVQSLRNRVEYLTQDRLLAVNSSVSAISARDLDGKPFVLDYSKNAKPTLLYIFSPTCGWCRRNLRNLGELLRTTSEKYTAVGVSLTRDGLGEYVAANSLPMQVIADIPPSTVMDYRLGGTPQTIVVSREGRVLKNWRGAYGGPVKAEVESFFGVHLPDDVGVQR